MGLTQSQQLSHHNEPRTRIVPIAKYDAVNNDCSFCCGDPDISRYLETYDGALNERISIVDYSNIIRELNQIAVAAQATRGGFAKVVSIIVFVVGIILFLSIPGITIEESNTTSKSNNTFLGAFLGSFFGASVLIFSGVGIFVCQVRSSRRRMEQAVIEIRTRISHMNAGLVSRGLVIKEAPDTIHRRGILETLISIHPVSRRVGMRRGIIKIPNLFIEIHAVQQVQPIYNPPSTMNMLSLQPSAPLYLNPYDLKGSSYTVPGFAEVVEMPSFNPDSVADSCVRTVEGGGKNLTKLSSSDAGYI